jgi:hypothetical protein
MTQMHDSGKRQEFSTGAVRDTADDKSRPDLISPFALERLGDWLKLGAQKYSERNWESGIPISRCIASLYRHLLAYQQNRREEDHIAAIMCNAMFVAHYEHEIALGLLPVGIDDMPRYNQFVRDEEKPTVYDCGSDARIVKSTLYICGPMRGYPRLNFAAFDKAAELGIASGFNVINPAELDRADGIDPNNPNLELATKCCDKIIRRDITAIMSLNPSNGDGLAVLRGWSSSVGATAEVALARWRGLRVVDAGDFTTEIR